MSEFRRNKRPWSGEQERENWKRPSSDERKRQREEAKPFDLMPANEKCDIFKVAFDYYTPRAHFMILPRDKSGTDYNSLDSEAKLKVVKATMAMVSHYKLQQSAILSFHFRSWITTKNMFHAHVCTDVKEYLSVLRTKKEKFPIGPHQRTLRNSGKRAKILGIMREMFNNILYEHISRKRLMLLKSTVEQSQARVQLVPQRNRLHHSPLFFTTHQNQRSDLLSRNLRGQKVPRLSVKPKKP